MFNTGFPVIGWVASLSNGEIVWEEPPVPEEKSSWQKLIDRLNAESLNIVHLRLQYFNTTIIALPAKQCDGYYQARETQLALFRRDSQGYSRRGIGSVVGDLVCITWIDGDGNIWQDVRPLQSEKIHTTLRDK